MGTPYEYDQRMADLRDRIAVALSPTTGPEKSIVTWLGMWDEPTLQCIADMAERLELTAYRHGMKAAELDHYDSGFNDGARAARESGERIKAKAERIIATLKAES